MKSKISACLIVRDEERHIGNCLKSIREHMDEILVVDTGSKDDTVRLAGKYADRILDFRWINDFSAARNFSLENAKNDFVFVTDADNTLISWNGDTVDRFTGSNRADSAGCVRITNKYCDGDEERTCSEYEIKIFNRKFFRYEGIIHEQVVPAGGGTFTRADLGIELTHSGYGADMESKGKAVRNISMLRAALEKNGDDCYLLYQLGKSYDYEKNYAGALGCYARAIELADNFDYDYVRNTVISYGYDLIRLNDFKGAAQIEKYGALYGDSADYVFLLAYIRMMNGMFPEAINLFLRCTELTGGEVQGVTSWMPLYNTGVIYECLGKRAEALRFYKLCGDYEKARLRIDAMNRESR